MEELHEPVSDETPVLDPAIQTTEPAIGTIIKPPQRTRSLVKDPEEVVKRLSEQLEGLIQERSEWSETRIQRVAKYRGWREGRDFPWENASDVHLPIILTDVQRTQDTLHNAVLSVRPVMNAKASTPAIEVKEKVIDKLLDYQIFTENGGELKIGHLISAFTEDGMFICYCPYIREKQKITTTHVVKFPPPGQSWDGWLFQHLQQIYHKSIILPGKKAPWQWIVRDENPLTGAVTERKIDVFLENEDEVQLVSHAEEVIFDGPAFIPVELEDIVVPTRCENLQPQTMSNPTGARVVYKIDYASKDEILRLIGSGFYDEVSKEQKEQLEAVRNQKDDNRDPESIKTLKDDLAGLVYNQTSDPALESFKRVMFFGKEDLDGDGFEEEVVYWFLPDYNMLLRARYLSEVYPSKPLRRPFAMAKYIPVSGQFYAIGLIEIMESGYDIIKKQFDQMLDSGDLTTSPWGFYRPMSGIRPEVMRMGPGDMYPTASPKDDVFFPTFNTNALGFGQNVIAMVSQVLDQATLVGQLQLGGVPQGKSAALRTTSNMQALLQQGDARPERVLRRFFHGLQEVWAQFHELNQHFLPDNKKFRISTGVTQDTDPYVQIGNKSEIQGRVNFEFSASILNTNRALAMNALQTMMGVLINPLLLQAGIVNVDNIYNLCNDFIKSLGQESQKYISKPSSDPFQGPKITAEDAIMSCMNGMMPYGSPMEPIEEHIAKIQEFVSDKKNMESFSSTQVALLAQYAAMRVQDMQQMLEQQQMMANAAIMQQQAQPNGKPGPAGQVNPPNTGMGGNPQTQGQELLDEALPGA